jgi:hypothetical protein
MPKGIYKVRTKEEFIEDVESSNSVRELLKKLNCNRNSLIKYFDNYNIKFPSDWTEEGKLIKSCVKRAIKFCNSYKMEDIMYALDETMPEDLQYKIKFNQIEKIKNKLLGKMAV